MGEERAMKTSKLVLKLVQVQALYSHSFIKLDYSKISSYRISQRKQGSRYNLTSELVEKVTSTTDLSESLVCDGMFESLLSAHICSFKDTYIQMPLPTGTYLDKPYSSL